MPSTRTQPAKLEFHPVTPKRWRDLEKLFGERGACGGCWCMWWRLKWSQFEKQKGAGNKKALKKIVKSGEAPGLLAYAGGGPVGWCSIAPRESYPRLERSRILKKVDDQPYRRQGLSVKLLRAAVAYAKKKGARMVEGYPVEPKRSPMPDVFAWTGLASAFRRAGFKEVLRRSPTRPIMRYPARKS